MRLTPPTKATFGLSLLAIAIGIVLHLGVVDLADLADVTNAEDYAFWLTAGGGILMAIGVLFRRI